MKYLQDVSPKARTWDLKASTIETQVFTAGLPTLWSYNPNLDMRIWDPFVVQAPFVFQIDLFIKVSFLPKPQCWSSPKDVWRQRQMSYTELQLQQLVDGLAWLIRRMSHFFVVNLMNWFGDQTSIYALCIYLMFILFFKGTFGRMEWPSVIDSDFWGWRRREDE